MERRMIRVDELRFGADLPLSPQHLFAMFKCDGPGAVPV